MGSISVSGLITIDTDMACLGEGLKYRPIIDLILYFVVHHIPSGFGLFFQPVGLTVVEIEVRWGLHICKFTSWMIMECIFPLLFHFSI